MGIGRFPHHVRIPASNVCHAYLRLFDKLLDPFEDRSRIVFISDDSGRQPGVLNRRLDRYVTNTVKWTLVRDHDECLHAAFLSDVHQLKQAAQRLRLPASAPDTTRASRVERPVGVSFFVVVLRCRSSSSCLIRIVRRRRSVRQVGGAVRFRIITVPRASCGGPHDSPRPALIKPPSPPSRAALLFASPCSSFQPTLQMSRALQ